MGIINQYHIYLNSNYNSENLNKKYAGAKKPRKEFNSALPSRGREGQADEVDRETS